jgi:tetratricopeptide (TPR) repeat protein
VQVYSNRAVAYNDIGEYAKAVDDLTVVLGLEPGNTISYYIRGIAYSGMGENAKAIEDFTTMIEQQPDFSPVFYYRGLVYEYLGQTELAIADYLHFLTLEIDIYSRLLAEDRLFALGVDYETIEQNASGVTPTPTP